MSISLSLLVACSLLLGGCWAGPVGLQSRIPHTGLRGPFSENALDRRGLGVAENFHDLRSRSNTPGSSKHSSIWVVIAVVCIILLICLLIIVWVIMRRSKGGGPKMASDEELGFGKYPEAQPDIAPPPKSYDGASASYSPPVESQGPFDNVQRKQPPPPLLTITSPEEEIGSKLTRVPVPRHLISPRLIGLPPSPRVLGLPTSPRPPPPGHNPSPDLPSDSSDSQSRSADSPPCDTAVSRGLTPPETPPEMDYYYHQDSLSAGGLERMMTQMERDLSDQVQSLSDNRDIHSARV